MKDFTHTEIYRARRYSTFGKWCTWYEPCKVVSHTPKFITIKSQDFPGNHHLYRGGTFKLNRSQLIKMGECYHSRHGEYFFLEKPEQGDLFPSADVTNAIPALEQYAIELGWDLRNLTNEQFEAYVFAFESK